MMTGIVIIAAIWAGSLLPPEHLPRIGGGDKLHHFAAYAACSFCWCAMVASMRSKLAWILGFATMGVAIECLQGASGIRHFELADMIANALGALVGGSLTLLVPRTWLATSPAVSTP